MIKALPTTRFLSISLYLLAIFVSALTSYVTADAASPTISGCSVFPADSVWNTPINTMPVDSHSSAYVSNIGPNTGLHPDFGSGEWDGGPIGIPYNVVPGTQPMVPITFDYADESDPGPYPIPPNAQIEGGSQSSGDRHVLVLNTATCMLYETWSTYPTSNGTWQAGSGAVFDLKSHALRPAGWTSSDAAGLPVLPGLLRYDEVASGQITHAIRFTVPKTQKKYIWPARHYASSITDVNYPPMGQRFRLKASFDISSFSPEVQVILRALKTYGMILADNGSAWYLSGAPDSRWNNDVLVSELSRVKGSDFEAIDESSLMINPDSGQAKAGGSSTNKPPTAEAGPDQTVNEGATVKLNGANSTDPDDGIASYAWTQTSGTRVTLSSASVASPTFTAPNVGVGGEALKFTLTVTDKGGLPSTDTCIVNVAWVNAPPAADAGVDQTVQQAITVTLDGSKSSDPDDGIATYSWRQISGTTVTLQGSATAHPTFVAPNAGQTGQTLTFELTVTDNGGLQAKDTCIVNVTAANAPPIASAGSNQSVIVGQTVKLDGSGSRDTDSGIASYLWKQTSGPPVTLSNPAAVQPTFVAPTVTQNGTALGFLLTVTDKGGLSSTSKCTVFVYTNTSTAPDLNGTWTSFSYSRGRVIGRFQIKNTGNGNAGQFTTSFYLSSDGTASGLLLKKFTVASLSAGQNVSSSLSYSSRSGLSGKYIIVVIDSGSGVSESNEKNNTVSQKIP